MRMFRHLLLVVLHFVIAKLEYWSNLNCIICVQSLVAWLIIPACGKLQCYLDLLRFLDKAHKSFVIGDEIRYISVREYSRHCNK